MRTINDYVLNDKARGEGLDCPVESGRMKSVWAGGG
jgi:hypothetical protein